MPALGAARRPASPLTEGHQPYAGQVPEAGPGEPGGDLGQARVSRPSTPRWPRHIVENPMLNGETIRLDGAIRMSPRS